MERNLTYFLSDVHLGLNYKNPARREERFVDFLNGIPAENTQALYLLGDIWDFWYEYEDVVPRGYVRVFAALTRLMDGGVKVFFIPGNHDIWCYSYFESLGMVKLAQPFFVTINGKRFCVGHGDGLGKGMLKYKALKKIFYSPFLQRMFSTLHPYIAFKIARSWSEGSRLAKGESYLFRGHEEPLYRWADGCKERADWYIFGHYHCHYEAALPSGGSLCLLRDWTEKANWYVFNGQELRYESR